MALLGVAETDIRAVDCDPPPKDDEDDDDDDDDEEAKSRTVEGSW